MARLNMKPRGLIGLPRNWRVITAASLTTIGLVYQTGQPVLGDWRSLTKGKAESTKPAAAKPVAKENGFSSTIQRLMAEARQYSEKGDWDKAVQLAERAAKISEASSQLLGPSSEFSPEATAQFANDLRSRRDAIQGSSSPASIAGRSQTRGTVISPPTTEPGKRLTVERAIAERPAGIPRQSVEQKPVQQPAELTAESPEDTLAWDEQLPPNPAPASVSENKPIKFRRSVLSRASQEMDEDFVDSLPDIDEAALPQIADGTVGESSDTQVTETAESPFEEMWTADLPVEELPVEELPNEPSKQVVESQPTFNDPVSPPAVEAEFSLNDTPQPSEADVFEPAFVPPPAPTAPQSFWEDEVLTESPTSEKTSATPVATAPVETELPATQETTAKPVFVDDFPVQRVVQLRRRLETAASLNPGAFTMPTSPVEATKSTADGLPEAAPVQSTSQSAALSPSSAASPKVDPEFELPTSASSIPSAAPAVVPKKVKLRREALQESRPSSREVSSTTPTQSARGSTEFETSFVAPSNGGETAKGDEPASNVESSIVAPVAARPPLRLREHRKLSNSVRTAMNEAAASPSSPASRRHVVGHSEPMVWQSAGEKQTHLPTLSISQEPSGARSATGKSLPPDLRKPTGWIDDFSGQQTVAKKSPAAGVEQTTFHDIDIPADSNPLTEHNGAATPTASSDLSDLDAASSGKTEASADESNQTASLTSFGVSRQSFALIEPLATSLQLPVATTASLLGGAGLALFGLGLILFRLAFRWRNS